jgi:hypothetical protein
MRTLLLDRALWDLCLDANGNIAVADAPYALAQDVATACRTNLGECYYDTSLGVPYAAIMGLNPSPTYLRAQFVKAALTVPGVVTATCVLNPIGQDRVLSGQIQFTDTSGVQQTVSF